MLSSWPVMSTPPRVKRFSAGPRRLSLAALLLVAAGPLVGCTTYEYDIVAPPELAQHIGTKQWVRAAQEPLEYRFITVESRLVMEIHNRTPDPVQLVGDRSVVVDPRGQSHGLRGQTIAPNSFVKLILPPMQARVERGGPSVGFGIGLGLGSAGYRGRRAYYPYGGVGYGVPLGYDEPRYYAVVDPNDSTYWEWSGEGEARLTLVYDHGGGKTFTHQFVFGRRKT